MREPRAFLTTNPCGKRWRNVHSDSGAASQGVQLTATEYSYVLWISGMTGRDTSSPVTLPRLCWCQKGVLSDPWMNLDLRPISHSWPALATPRKEPKHRESVGVGGAQTVVKHDVSYGRFSSSHICRDQTCVWVTTACQPQVPTESKLHVRDVGGAKQAYSS